MEQPQKKTTIELPETLSQGRQTDHPSKNARRKMETLTGETDGPSPEEKRLLTLQKPP